MPTLITIGAAVTAAALHMPVDLNASTGTAFSPNWRLPYVAHDENAFNANGTYVNAAYTSVSDETPTRGLPVPSHDLSPAASAALGDIGVERFAMFRTLGDGWSGDGAALDPYSIGALNAFFDQGARFPSAPSLFMRKDGSLQLVGESTGGGTMEFDFRKGSVYYYAEDAGREGVIELAREGLQELVNLSRGQVV